MHRDRTPPFRRWFRRIALALAASALYLGAYAINVDPQPKPVVPSRAAFSPLMRRPEWRISNYLDENEWVEGKTVERLDGAWNWFFAPALWIDKRVRSRFWTERWEYVGWGGPELVEPDGKTLEEVAEEWASHYGMSPEEITEEWSRW